MMHVKQRLGLTTTTTEPDSGNSSDNKQSRGAARNISTDATMESVYDTVIEDHVEKAENTRISTYMNSEYRPSVAKLIERGSTGSVTDMDKVEIEGMLDDELIQLISARQQRFAAEMSPFASP